MNWLNNKLKTLAEDIGEFSPSCRRAVRLQSEALDHPLTFRQRLGLRFHLLLCKWCRRYGKHITFLRTAVRHDESEIDSMPQILPPETRERIKRRLHPEAE
jgi:hypothetical protein